MELKLTLPNQISFEEHDHLNLLTNQKCSQFKEALEQLPLLRFQNDLVNQRGWVIRETSSGNVYEILQEIKERRQERKIILRPQNITQCEIHDVANLSKLYLILINIFINGHLN
jgi:hypothetical protein